MDDSSHGPASRARFSRRQWLARSAGGLTALWLAPGRTQTSSGSVLQFGADPSGKKDSTTAFAEAIGRFDVVDVPAGTFVIGNVGLRSGLTIQGAGEHSILRQKPGPGHAFLCDSGSPDPAANLHGLTLRRLQLRGNCDIEGFAEHAHLMSLNGVSDVVIEDVVFRGFRGDGLYLGSSHRPRTERHNRNVLVRRCVFDGIDHANRNGISVIDCDGLIVERSRFVDIARADMPGAIDLEPDGNAFHVIRNIRIARNTFTATGGNGGTIAMFVPRRLKTPAANISIEENIIDGAAASAFFLIQLFAPGSRAASQNIVVRANRVRGQVMRPFELRGVVGVELRDNRFEGSARPALIGKGDSKDAVRDTVLRGNTFRDCGADAATALAVANVDGLTLAGNEWIDAGNGEADASAIRFVAGAARRIFVSGNRFSSPGGRTRFAIRKEAASRLDAASSVYASDNRVDGSLRVEFEGPVLRAR